MHSYGWLEGRTRGGAAVPGFPQTKEWRVLGSGSATPPGPRRGRNVFRFGKGEKEISAFRRAPKIFDFWRGRQIFGFGGGRAQWGGGLQVALLGPAAGGATDVGLTMESSAKRCQGMSKKGKIAQILYVPRSSDAPQGHLCGVCKETATATQCLGEVGGSVGTLQVWGRVTQDPTERSGWQKCQLCVCAQGARSSADGPLVCPALGSDGSFPDPWGGCDGGGVTL